MRSFVGDVSDVVAHVNGNPDHRAAEDHPVLDEPLEIKFRSTPRPVCRQLSDDDQTARRQNGDAEADVVHPAESQEVAGEDIVFAGEKTGHLGRRIRRE